MKRVLIVLLVMALLLFPCSLIAAQEENAQDSLNQSAEVTDKGNTGDTAEEENKDNNSAEKGIPKLEVNWQEMQDMQIALAIINRQIEYLMAQVEKSDAEIAEIKAAHEKELEKVKEEKEAEIDKVNQKLADKEREFAYTVARVHADRLALCISSA